MPTTAYKRNYSSGKKTPGQKHGSHRQMVAMRANRRKKKTV